LLKDRYNLAEREVHFNESEAMATICKHPKVRIVPGTKTPSMSSAWSVARSLTPRSFRDMEIEETAEPEEALDDE